MVVLVWQLGLAAPTGKLPAGSLPMRSVVPVGNPAIKVGSYGFEGKFTPFASTVIPAPSSAPIRLGSCNCSARLPLSPASQPTTASSGKRSTCGLLAVGVKDLQAVPLVLPQVAAPVGSKGLAAVVGEPLSDRPNRQTTFSRQMSSLPAGWVFALMILEAPPTPCSRTGFHMINNSLCAPGECTLVAEGVVHAAAAPVAVVHVGSTRIMSPGAAASIAAWIELEGET